MRQITRRAALILGALGLRVDPGDWLLPGRLLGCAYPRSDAALSGLASQGVRVLVNLHERAHADDRLARHGLISVHVPLRDFSTPTAEQIGRAVAAIEAAVERGQPVAVHCGGGIGRTGTILACYLVAQGATAADAIRQVRQLRPGSVETQGQVAAIQAYADQVRATTRP